MRPGVSVDSNRFKHVFSSKYGKVRIFKVMSVSQESKDWVADPANRVCDAPGSWYCTGQYPPAIRPLIEKRKDFSQLEDFNANRDAAAKAKSEKYQKEYMARMAAGGGGHGPSSQTSRPDMKATTAKKWRDTPETSAMHKLVQAGDFEKLKMVLTKNPGLAQIRSADGRGPLWWAYESGNSDIVKLLKMAGAREDARDANGVKPAGVKP